MHNMIVYGIELNGQRKIVAAPSFRRAAILLQVSQYILRSHGGSISSDHEIDVACSDAGAVFARTEECSDWSPLPASRRSRLIPQNGGYRAGSGRKREAATTAEGLSVRLTDEQYAHYLELGGTTWLRAQLRKLEDAVERTIPSRRKSVQLKLRRIRLCASDRAVFIGAGGAIWLRSLLKGSKAAKGSTLAAHPELLTAN